MYVRISTIRLLGRIHCDYNSSSWQLFCLKTAYIMQSFYWSGPVKSCKTKQKKLSISRDLPGLTTDDVFYLTHMCSLLDPRGELLLCPLTLLDFATRVLCNSVYHIQKNIFLTENECTRQAHVAYNTLWWKFLLYFNIANRIPSLHNTAGGTADVTSA